MDIISAKELREYRYLFPVCKEFIYLNHALVAPISLRVADAVQIYNQEALHEGYTASERWSRRLIEIRQKCAQLIHASAEEVAFIHSTSHGLSTIARGLKLKSGDEVLISDSEFPANVYPWIALEKQGIVVKKIPFENHELPLDRLENYISPQTRLISLSSVQYGNGYRLPLEKIGRFCRKQNIYFMVDAIQSLGAFPINVQENYIDFLAADAHKWMLGHEGVGLLYVRKELIEKIEPPLIGWMSVQNAHDFDHLNFTLKKTAGRFEEGSHNGLSIHGLGAAVELILDVGVKRIAHRILSLTDLLIFGLQDLGLQINNSQKPEYRSGSVFFSFQGENSQDLLKKLHSYLFSKSIYVSIRKGSIRLSPHFYNSEDEIEATLKEISNFLLHHRC